MSSFEQQFRFFSTSNDDLFQLNSIATPFVPSTVELLSLKPATPPPSPPIQEVHVPPRTPSVSLTPATGKIAPQKTKQRSKDEAAWPYSSNGPRRNIKKHAAALIKKQPSKHTSCEGCRRVKTKCDRRPECRMCRLRDEPCVWIGAKPSQPAEPEEVALQSLTAQESATEIMRLRGLVSELSDLLEEERRKSGGAHDHEEDEQTEDAADVSPKEHVLVTAEVPSSTSIVSDLEFPKAPVLAHRDLKFPNNSPKPKKQKQPASSCLAPVPQPSYFQSVPSDIGKVPPVPAPSIQVQLCEPGYTSSPPSTASAQLDHHMMTVDTFACPSTPPAPFPAKPSLFPVLTSSIPEAFIQMPSPSSTTLYQWPASQPAPPQIKFNPGTPSTDPYTHVLNPFSSRASVEMGLNGAPSCFFTSSPLTNSSPFLANGGLVFQPDGLGTGTYPFLNESTVLQGC